MTYSVLICDDSGLARKQMARALPESWATTLDFATNGAEAVAWLRSNPVDVMFLDLTMPEMDGYQVLEWLQQEGLEVKVIVVSGDIQPEAHQRVMNLGALEFLQKPVAPEKVLETIERFSLRPDTPTNKNTVTAEFEVDLQDCYREVVNVAMGQAADRLARLLGVFVRLPVPKVNFIEPTEIQMALEAVSDHQSLSAVCQGFIGSGISGEAMLLFADSDFSDIGQLMNFNLPLSEHDQLDLLMDVANILISACLKGRLTCRTVIARWSTSPWDRRLTGWRDYWGCLSGCPCPRSTLSSPPKSRWLLKRCRTIKVCLRYARASLAQAYPVRRCCCLQTRTSAILAS